MFFVGLISSSLEGEIHVLRYILKSILREGQRLVCFQINNWSVLGLLIGLFCQTKQSIYWPIFGPVSGLFSVLRKAPFGAPRLVFHRPQAPFDHALLNVQISSASCLSSSSRVKNAHSPVTMFIDST